MTIALLAVLLAIALPGRSSGTQAEGGSLAVGLYESPPFVMFDAAGTPSGLAVDLWALVAADLGAVSTFTAHDTLRDLTDAIERGDVDIGVTSLTITKDRLRRMDFSQPWFDSGLRVMVVHQDATGWRAVLQGLSDAGHLEAYAWLGLVILLGTVGFTLFDRTFDAEFPPRWRDGVAHSFHTVMHIAVSGRTPRRRNLFGWIGRIGQALWLVCGLAVVAYVTSSVTSVMTMLAIADPINGPADLPGKRVGVIEGSYAEEFGTGRGYAIRSFAGIAAAAQALTEGGVDAIVADAPVLRYYAHINPGLNLNVVGPVFEPDKYGFALGPDSPLTDAVSISILALWEAGTIRALDTDYFGHGW